MHSQAKPFAKISDGNDLAARFRAKGRRPKSFGRESAQARHDAREAAVAQAEVRARLEAQGAALVDRLKAAAEQAQRRQADELETVRAERAEAEETLARWLRWSCGWRRGGAVDGAGRRPGGGELIGLGAQLFTATMTNETERADATQWIRLQRPRTG